MTQSPTRPQAPPPGPPMAPPELPGATAGLVLGICSIVFSAPIIGLILGFIGFQKARGARKVAELNPGIYSNAGVAQAGYVCCIIGLILGGISTLFGCVSIVLFAVLAAGAAAAASQAGGLQ